MKRIIAYFGQFKRFLGNKLYFLLALTLLVGFFEGVGITLFLPILRQGFGDDKLSKILKAVFGIFHMEFSFALMLVLILAFFVLRAACTILYARYFGKM